MTTRRITAPTALAVTLVDARASARASGTALDAELAQKIQDYAEAAEHKTGRALTDQTWELTLDAFPAVFELRPSPVTSVKSVKYYDTAGVLQTVAAADYVFDPKSVPARIFPAAGKSWPSTQDRPSAVEVQFVCGFGPTDATVPASIKGYILGMIENDYFPNPNAQYLARKLDREKVYG